MSSPATTRIDLLVATVDRTTELSRLLTSIAGQTYRRLRVIVVDQNRDNRLDSILSAHRHALTIVHVRAERGLSRARNVGLRHTSAELVGFPDDDCWYPPDIVEQVVLRFDDHPDWDGLSLMTTDVGGQPSSMLWDRTGGPIDRFNIWRRAISPGIFVRRTVIESVGGFAVELGVGSGTRWGSGEETDFLLRAIEAGQRIQYDPTLKVFHDSPRPSFDRPSAQKGYLLGLGHGHLLRTKGYPAWFAIYRVAQLLFGSVFFLVTLRPAKARFYFLMAAGRAAGWRAG
jgi:GT2 family glycosyltransferase